jgi:hypothetical protein
MSFSEVSNPTPQGALDHALLVHPAEAPQAPLVLEKPFPLRSRPTPLQPSPGVSRRRAWFWRLFAGLLIVGSAWLHVSYLLSDPPLDLAPDEAHYWDWSRHLDWSYYSKGPLVAYLIRAGCALAEPWSVEMTGNAALAVRLPAIVCGSLLLLSLYVLTLQVFGREPLAATVVLLALTLPLFVAGSGLMTIDAPYTCCWGWALVLAHRAIFRGSGWAWVATGLVVGLGILAKYTMVLWFPSLGLFLLTSREHRHMLGQRGFWTMTAVAALAGLPILVWNAAHDWVSVLHVHNLTGAGQSQIQWFGPIAYLATQCGVLVVFWFVAWVEAMIAHRPTKETDAGLRYLWWLSLPTFLVFLGFSPKTGGGEANWPAAAYISGLVLTAGWLARELQTRKRARFLWTIATLVVAGGVGVAGSYVLHHAERLYPLLTALVGRPTEEKPHPLRQLDPSCRLRGWRTLAAEVDRVRAELRAEGVEPVLAATNWSLPGELGFYCAGHPEAHSIGLALHDRRSQYDFWRPNPIWDVEAFRGRTFIVVGPHPPEIAAGFEELGPPRVVTHYEHGQPIAAWGVRVCRGFRGFAPVDELLRAQRF